MSSRREFVALLGGAAAAWPLAARAQQRTIPVVGYLNGGSDGPFAPFLDAFCKGLRDGKTWRSNTAGPRELTTNYQRSLQTGPTTSSAARPRASAKSLARMCRFPASGSSWESLAHGGADDNHP
jgi:hypothetical protein